MSGQNGNNGSIKKLLKLPIGIQDFENLRQEGYLYVDKTKYLIDIIDTGKVYFLSRPRRFGKSLTISTFDALFSGKTELFEGLYAEEFMNRPDYKISPVVRLDMSRTTTDQNVDALRTSMLLQVLSSARRYGIELSELAKTSPGTALAELMKLLSEKHGRVVILVDEYDKPILDTLFDLERAETFRTTLRAFYTQIKANDEYTRFVFMTGITKFTKTGVFSAMNNLRDISMNDDYATMLGYTDEELKHYFAMNITRTADKLHIPEGELLARIKDYYNGFSFDGVHSVYNPFSTLNFFADGTFRNYWFESGSPSFIVDYIKRHDLDIEEFRGKEEEEAFTAVSEIELAKPSSFLFQAGYLTVRERRGMLLILDYPNTEVLSSMALLFLYGKYSNEEGGVIRIKLEEELKAQNPEAIIRFYRQVLASIPYDIYERAGKKGKEPGEAFFHAVLLTLLWAARIPTTAENHSYKGRSDVEIVYRGRVYIIELKVADGAQECENAADEAIAQIKTKGYADKHDPMVTTLIGIAVDKSARQIGAHRIERL